MRSLPQNRMTRMMALFVALGVIALHTQAVLAHTRVEVGPYVIIVGWANEPPIVNERNALAIEIMEGDRPVTGVEGTLDLTVLYGGRTFIGNLNPTPTPGLYHVEILPTRRGQFSVQLQGMIGDTAVDEVVEPEEVLTAAVLQFPESPPETMELQASIDDLTSRLQTVTTLATVGIVAGGLGIIVALVAVLRRR